MFKENPTENQTRKKIIDELLGKAGWNINNRSEEVKRLNVATIQTMMGSFNSFSPGFSDLVISDECHRSIYNKWKDVLSYFHALQIGLTATPCDFVERDTFKFFNSTDNQPTFNYPYEQAVSEKNLVDFRPAYTAKTNFQIIGIRGNELPLSIQKKLLEEGLTLEEIDFEGTDIEKKVTNLGTNESLVREFMDVCIKDDTGVVPGKSIIFVISHEHAKRVWTIFNQLYPEYKGKLVEIIDSKMERPLSILTKFKNENYPRIAISVDMLDTGVDIREVVNLVFAKPIFSKIKFWQMIGRGTRTLNKDEIKPWCTEKDKFLIIDHWNNFEYFGEIPDGEAPIQQDAITVKIFKVRLKKLRIFQQKKNINQFEIIKNEIISDIKSLPDNSITVKENRRDIDKALSNQIWDDLEHALNSPELYINEDNLRKTFSKPYGTFIQFIKNILGVYKFPDPEEIINESFNTYIIERNNAHPLNAEQIRFLRAIKNVFTTKKSIKYDDLFKPPFTQFGADAATRLFSDNELLEIVTIFNSTKAFGGNNEIIHK